MAREGRTTAGPLKVGPVRAPDEGHHGSTAAGDDDTPPPVAVADLLSLLAPEPDPLEGVFPDGSIGADLVRNTRHFSFTQATRILESSAPDSNRVGGVARPALEPMRLRSHVSLGFPSSDIDHLEILPPLPDEEQGENESRPRIAVITTFLGLFGSQSPLPAWMSEEILDRDVDDNPRRDFLDFFHHRLLSFLPRIWEKYRYWSVYREGALDPFSTRTFSFIGLIDNDLRQKSDDLDWERLLAYIGLLAGRNRSGDVVRGVIAHSFHLPGKVRVEEFVRRTVIITEPQQNRLGRANSRLAGDCHLGGHIPDRNGKFRLWLGPLDFERFFGFLPIEPHFDTLRRLIAFMLRDQLAYDLCLVLKRAEVPPFRLNDGKCLLGWSTWLGEPSSGDQSVILTARQ
jgi:type VI secretion system protein ImpH